MSVQSAGHFDYILTGAGLAGLTLALELARRPAFRERRILLLDRDDKNRNDRTWCFWATDTESLPPVTAHRWDRCYFFGKNFQTKLEFAPYRYCMVRGLDFYRWAKNKLLKYPNVQWQVADIQNIDSDAGLVNTSAGAFTGHWIFNSAFTPTALLPGNSPLFNTPFTSRQPAKSAAGNILLLQHFKGWIIETGAPAFDPATPTFMDFRPEQHGETRFVYVLPFSEMRALVEFTVFSPALLPAETYDAELRLYLKKHLKISDFEIKEQEFGIIPMTDFAFPGRAEGRVIHIGTAGGFVKASSGYAFKRTQRRLRAFVDAWEKTGSPNPAVFRAKWRFRALDSIFLRVLADGGAPGRQIFTDLFQKLPAPLVLRFLDEDATFADILRVLRAPPAWPFLRAALRQLPGIFRV